MTILHRITRRLGVAGTVAVIILLLLVIVAIFAPWIAPYGPQDGTILNSYAQPGAQHWLGTDANGFDVLSRLIIGSRTSLLGPAAVIVLSLLVGLPLALAGAWRGGIVDTVISRIADILFALPGLLLAVVGAALFGPGLTPAVIAIAISYLPYVARVVRSAALQQRVQPYVTALEVQGVSGTQICVRHILPNIGGIVLAQATLAFGYALSDLAALSFLGLGVQAPQPDWGVLVNDQAGLRNGHATQVVAASVVIIVTIAALSLLGERLAGDQVDALQRRIRRSRRRRSAGADQPAQRVLETQQPLARAITETAL